MFPFGAPPVVAVNRSDIGDEIYRRQSCAPEDPEWKYSVCVV